MHIYIYDSVLVWNHTGRRYFEDGNNRREMALVLEKNVAGLECDVVSVYWGGAAILKLKSVTDIAWGGGKKVGMQLEGVKLF